MLLLSLALRFLQTDTAAYMCVQVLATCTVSGAWQAVAGVEIIRLVWLPCFSCFIVFFSYACWLGLTLPNLTL